MKEQAFQAGLPGSVRVGAQNASLVMVKVDLKDNSNAGDFGAAVAVVQQRPANGKLLLDIVASVSGHVDSGRLMSEVERQSEQQHNADGFAKSNVYRAEIVYPDGSSEPVSAFGPGKSGKAEHASVLSVEIDLSKVPPGGTVQISAHPEGSSGSVGLKHLRSVDLIVP